MKIYPNTVVKLLTGIPLSNDYKDTITWKNETTQANWFASKAIKSYSDFSYQRYNPDLGKISAIRIPDIADNLYNCNYLMFQNTHYGMKWFYAFIKAINYINDGLTEILFEIDILQTYFFNITFHPSFIVREHVNNDTIGAHLIPEGLEIGDYVIGESQNSGLMNPDKGWIGIACTYDEEFNIATGKIINYVYNGVNILTFNSYVEVNKFLEAAVENNKADGILNIFMIPEFMVNKDLDTRITILKDYGTFDGYRPKNNKLYCYPYNFLQVYSGNGTPSQYHYEYFNSVVENECLFRIDGDLSPNPECLLIPLAYQIQEYGTRTPNTRLTNQGYILGLNGFPQCSWVTDTYKMYLASQATSTPASVISNVIGTGFNVAANLATGNIIGAVGSGLGFATDIFQFVAGREDKSTMAPSSYGATDNMTSYSYGLRDFWFSNVKIRKEFAQIIDNYFSMFGYKINRVKQPNIYGRQNWNFVETKGAIITGNLPVDDLEKIISSLDKGITFWHTTDVGNYNLPNGIVGG